MRNVLFLVLPLAFIVGFIPYFWGENVDYTSTTLYENVDVFNMSEDDEIYYNPQPNDAELLSYSFFEDATKLTYDGIVNV